jgi:hypothetical protein
MSPTDKKTANGFAGSIRWPFLIRWAIFKFKIAEAFRFSV